MWTDLNLDLIMPTEQQMKKRKVLPENRRSIMTRNVRNVGLKGRQKLADIWDKYPYIVKSQPINDIPVFEVQQEHSPSKTRLLHRNMLLPFSGLPSIDDEEDDEEQIDSVVETPVDDRYTDNSSD